MKICAGLAALAAASTFAAAGNVVPTSYDMLNGQTGSFTYWDDSYNGTGSPTTSGDLLTGGLGDLTDGVIATENWFSTPGPYVGWDSITPTITVRATTITPSPTPIRRRCSSMIPRGMRGSGPMRCCGRWRCRRR